MAIVTTKVDVTANQGWAQVAAASGSGTEYSACTQEPAAYTVSTSLPAQNIPGELHKPNEPFRFTSKASGDTLYVRSTVGTYTVNLMTGS